ncbi:PREDICTED: uncharacterized protein LOC105366357 [Ceratosolen solmsi marchali]|uniref:Uncharacterized protein LOC105366357 n=1 Tax=Ceratosolen solmsi marchali TaxID=326594 RepID=A0AAJ6YRX3_9HYME|nr:PREDICTED: uncharacterized protein LOC105366357 [Ceratosolen solmsi marchali]
MTRSKIQRIKFFVFLLSFIFSQKTSCDGSFRKKYETAEHVPFISKSDNKESVETISVLSKNKLADPLAQGIVYNVSVNNSKKLGVNVTSKTINELTTTYSPITPTMQMTNGMHISSLNSGAFLRGIFVIIGLSIIVMAYMVFRGFRLSKTRAQMVRKYGVLAHRQDVEMRPLPLDEDDEDDTIVFDASNIASNTLQSQDT